MITDLIVATFTFDCTASAVREQFTNPKQRLDVLRLQVGADVVYSLSAEFRVSRTIAEEETIQF